jgi:hypothetical protein
MSQRGLFTWWVRSLQCKSGVVSDWEDGIGRNQDGPGTGLLKRYGVDSAKVRSRVVQGCAPTPFDTSFLSCEAVSGINLGVTHAFDHLL